MTQFVFTQTFNNLSAFENFFPSQFCDFESEISRFFGEVGQDVIYILLWKINRTIGGCALR